MMDDDPEVAALLEQVPERARPFILAQLRARMTPPPLTVEERAVARAERAEEEEARWVAESRLRGVSLTAGLMRKRF